MHKKLISFIKYNKFFLAVYRFVGNIGIKILTLFIPINPKQILFMSFGGQKYDDSPKAVYEKIIKDDFFKDYKIIWSFTNPKKFDHVKCQKVKTDSLKFYITALSSKFWINNSSVERGLYLRRKETVEINTWHGTPLKKMGRDINTANGYASKSRKKENVIYCSQSEYDQEIFVRLFNTGKEHILLCDLPRNDELTVSDDDKIKNLKQKLKLPENKKIILYAPTFREYARDKVNGCYIKPPISVDKWKEMLGNDYIVLFRAHYEIVKTLGIEDNGFIFNFSNYPYLNHLILISDMLISDYSSIYFDYSITGKPMLNFSYDYEEYLQKRGLYLDLKEILPCNINYSEDTLIEEIKNINEQEYMQATRAFKERFAPNAGNAAQCVVDKLKEIIKK